MKPSACPFCGSLATEPAKWYLVGNKRVSNYECARPGCGHKWTIENGRLKIELPDEWRSI